MLEFLREFEEERKESMDGMIQGKDWVDFYRIWRRKWTARRARIVEKTTEEGDATR